MSDEQERDDELTEAAQELAVQLKVAKRNSRGDLVDLGALTEDDEEETRAAIQQLIEDEDDSVEAFDGDVDLALRYVRQVVADSAEA